MTLFKVFSKIILDASDGTSPFITMSADNVFIESLHLILVPL